jgi:topoisomerase-4 subunit A
MVPADGDYLLACIPVTASHLALLGDNRKILLCAVVEIPEMKKGQGVIIQKYKEGGVADYYMLNPEESVSWKMGERIRTEPNLIPWIGKRATMGRLPPMGFPRHNKFTLL